MKHCAKHQNGAPRPQSGAYRQQSVDSDAERLVRVVSGR